MPARIALLEHQRLGSAIDNWIVKLLLEEQLGLGTRLVSELDLNSTFTYNTSVVPDDLLISGAISADMEYWQNKPDTWYDRNVAQQLLVQDVGPTGITGQRGWFIPWYMLNASLVEGTLDYWRSYRKPEAAALLMTDATRGFGTGELSAGSPSWGAEAALITNLRLNLTAIWYGNESDLITAVVQRIQKHEPVLFCLWTPHPLFARFNATRVQLPEYAAECWDSPSDVDCDYPLVVPRKLVSLALQNHADALYLLQQFTLTTQQQSEIMADVTFNKKSLPEACCAWLRGNEVIWRKWFLVPPPRAPLPPTDASRVRERIVLISVVVALALLVVSIAVSFCYWRSQGRRRRQLALAPSGDVAIVFTDIQDSTRLWEINFEMMQASLEIHNTTVRKLIQTFHGYEVKTSGDSFMIAFAQAAHAARFAVRLQAQLLQQDWPARLLALPDMVEHSVQASPTVEQTQVLPTWRGLRVRVGCSVGLVDREYDSRTQRVDYFGPAVNCAARIESLAYGGQVLISDAMALCLEGAVISEGEELHCFFVGEFQLKGMARPQRVHQLEVPGLRARSFPPIHPLRAMKESILERNPDGSQLCVVCARKLFCRHCTPGVHHRGSLVSNTSVAYHRAAVYSLPAVSSRVSAV
eukprot:TRINITY_DN3286_c0_g1_i1.p1 TRINITY_DN3286_c0_g1~~TRINITY_DN3286_c0_g1_i1.p1  ORF type:complete len:695 (-),score=71.23 TRINITY_DN3286_c0_g1_i1:9-1925(-)